MSIRTIRVYECNRCHRVNKNIILASADHRYHLCLHCIAELLEWILNPVIGQEIPEEERGKKVKCDFCEGAWNYEGLQHPYTIRLKDQGEDQGEYFYVCSTCLLRGARKGGGLRITRDC